MTKTVVLLGSKCSTDMANSFPGKHSYFCLH